MGPVRGTGSRLLWSWHIYMHIPLRARSLPETWRQNLPQGPMPRRDRISLYGGRSEQELGRGGRIVQL